MSAPSLRQIPSVHVLLDHERAPALIERHGREPVREAIRAHLDGLRAQLSASQDAPTGADAILDAVDAALAAGGRRAVRRSVNATGVILHTGLGRAVLPAAALEAIRDELGGYASLEVDVSSGKRARRDLAVRERLTQLTGAEDATVVNNNASAVLLVLAALARGKEVIVSRGELVEIGGSFRIPDVMAESGAALVEVGTTNKTRIEDYERAITANTALLLAVHTSNFRVVGFTESPTIEQLSLLGKEKRIVVVHDVGSGALTRFHGVDPATDAGGGRHAGGEPAMDHSIRCGVDIVTASADKLLGGPQGGLIVGRAELIERVRRHPLARAVRVDKLQLVALEATLRLYGDVERARSEVPALAMMMMPLAAITRRAECLADRIRHEVPGARVELDRESSRLGSGSLPEHTLPTRVVVVRIEGVSAEQVSAALRAHEPPVFARIVKDRVLIDPRTLRPGDDEVLVSALQSTAKA
jgi:L-seryl-tRNA(Ser) seleniumtransferase